MTGGWNGTGQIALATPSKERAGTESWIALTRPGCNLMDYLATISTGGHFVQLADPGRRIRQVVGRGEIHVIKPTEESSGENF
jgi:hypothetical protein